jgi:hypothetical protein
MLPLLIEFSLDARHDVVALAVGRPNAQARTF